MTSNTANEAKLHLAVDWELKAKFQYQGAQDSAPRERRLFPDDVWVVAGVLYVGGIDADEDDYRQFRLDRIVGEVVIK